MKRLNLNFRLKNSYSVSQNSDLVIILYRKNKSINGCCFQKQLMSGSFCL